MTINSGSSQTISGIPTGTSCTVSETPPTPPTGYWFGTPTFSPDATVTISTKDATVEVTTNNTLTRDLGVCAVGEGIAGNATFVTEWLQALGPVPVRMLSQAAGRRNITVVIPDSDLPVALTRVHEVFFG